MVDKPIINNETDGIDESVCPAPSVTTAPHPDVAEIIGAFVSVIWII